jgi:hypothetical protein
MCTQALPVKHISSSSHPGGFFVSEPYLPIPANAIPCAVPSTLRMLVLVPLSAATDSLRGLCNPVVLPVHLQSQHAEGAAQVVCRIANDRQSINRNRVHSKDNRFFPLSPNCGRTHRESMT